MEQLYFPGRDYPDREKWLDRRYTPSSGFHATLYFDSGRWGTLKLGINELKRQIRAEAATFRKSGKPLALEMPDGRIFFVQHEKCLPLRARLMDVRRKVQRQGHVTIERDRKAMAQAVMKDKLK